MAKIVIKIINKFERYYAVVPRKEKYIAQSAQQRRGRQNRKDFFYARGKKKKEAGWPEYKKPARLQKRVPDKIKRRRVCVDI
jgi:hypothetical protein